MPHNYTYHFEIKPGKFVFIPNEESLKFGRQVVNEVTTHWSPENFFYHFGQRGGHVAALRQHQQSSYLAKIDLAQFFSQITRTKIIRSLKKVGISKRNAFDIAYASVVSYQGKKFLPYGFVQSMVLATLCLEKSALGSCLKNLSDEGINVSVYVDDIILSSNSFILLQRAYNLAIEAAGLSRFVVNEDKSNLPAKKIEVFNCELSEDTLVFTEERLHRFTRDVAQASDLGKEAIAKYMSVINQDQFEEVFRSLSVGS